MLVKIKELKNNCDEDGLLIISNKNNISLYFNNIIDIVLQSNNDKIIIKCGIIIVNHMKYDSRNNCFNY